MNSIDKILPAGAPNDGLGGSQYVWILAIVAGLMALFLLIDALASWRKRRREGEFYFAKPRRSVVNRMFRRLL